MCPYRFGLELIYPIAVKNTLATVRMALDDPIVWVLIIAVVIFLFGSSKIPQFAKSIGQARREFEQGWRGISNEIMTTPAPSPHPASVQPAVQRPPPPPPAPAAAQGQQLSSSDPLVVACQNEGIDTTGKTKEQLASELSWKLNKK